MNIWNDEGDPRRIELINRELRRLDPDLVSLQEVLRTADKDQLAALLDGTGLHGTHQGEVVTLEPRFADRFGGNAVASRWPHRIVDAVDLGGADVPDVPWRALAALVPLPDLGDMLLIVPTISYQLEAEAARERQVMVLADLDARLRTEVPTIIAGDFNATPDSAGIRFLTGLQSIDGRSTYYHDAWAIAGDGPGHTWTVDNPNAHKDIGYLVGQSGHRRRIDYIFVGAGHAHPKVRARIHAAAVAFNEPVDGVWPSDHFGLVADLVF